MTRPRATPNKSKSACTVRAVGSSFRRSSATRRSNRGDFAARSRAASSRLRCQGQGGGNGGCGGNVAVVAAGRRRRWRREGGGCGGNVAAAAVEGRRRDLQSFGSLVIHLVQGKLTLNIIHLFRPLVHLLLLFLLLFVRLFHRAHCVRLLLVRCVCAGGRGLCRGGRSFPLCCLLAGWTRLAPPFRSFVKSATS